ncbi:RING-type E3 ubiquitin transferase [Salvia divinorum]|uniref:RING-type E3 ubiquitin transferase n=1 Tax=Salvia divinorum TaxID=28513 RepID=A0ABD1HZV1_SALDI
MDMDAAALSATPSRCPFDHTSAAAATAFTPSGDNFLLSSPYFHRLINNLATSADAGNPRSDPAPRSAIESLKEFTITTDSDASMLCPVCKDPFAVDSVVKVMPCEHTYHSDCIVPWLETNNSCPVCRYKLPVVGERMAVNEGEGYLGSVRFEELVDEVDLYGFRNTLRRRRYREELTRPIMHLIEVGILVRISNWILYCFGRNKRSFDGECFASLHGGITCSESFHYELLSIARGSLD